MGRIKHNQTHICQTPVSSKGEAAKDASDILGKRKARFLKDNESEPPKKFEKLNTQKSLLLSLPRELLENIINSLPYAEIAKARLVCRGFNTMGQEMLSREFRHIQASIQQRFQHIKSQMPRRESSRRRHPLARECDIIETIHMRLTLLHMTFSKHIDRGHCCFFAGEILDEIRRILKYIKGTSNLARAYKVTDELFDLSTMAMEYFKEAVEPYLPEISYFSTELQASLDALTIPTKKSLVLPSTSTPEKDCENIINSIPYEEEIFPSPKPCFISDIPSTPDSPYCSKQYVKHKISKLNTQTACLQRNVLFYKRKVCNIHKRLLKTTAKLENYDRKFEEQNRKFEEMWREFRHCQEQLKCYQDSPCKCHNFLEKKSPK